MAVVALYAEHEIKYTNRDPLPVKDVVQSLQALEKISTYFLPRSLSALSNTEILGAELFVIGFEHGSLVEKIVIKLIFGSEDKLDAFLEKIHDGEIKEALKIAYESSPGGANKVYKLTAISAVVAILIALGAAYAVHAMSDDSSQPSIQANNNAIIVIGAEAYRMSPETFSGIVDASIGAQRKRLAKEAVKVVAPAKRDPAGSVVLDENTELSIPNDVVRVTPEDAHFGSNEYTESYSDVDVQIRATDRDSGNRGWAAVIPSLVNKRVKLVLPNEVNVSALANKFSVRADVTVTFRIDARNATSNPTRIEIDRLVTPE